MLLSQLTVADLSHDPVWEFTHSDDPDDDETAIRPVFGLPVSDLKNRVVGIEVTLSNDSKCWAILGNIALYNSRQTRHFLTISVEREGNWFDLARYHDVDYSRRGHAQLAAFLGMSVEKVFPIRYDLSPVVVSTAEGTRGAVPLDSDDRLSSNELIALALE